jgi:predicted house-cleaning noncanonical NTP pyrophosphatase (MazG superfamily)
MEKIYNKLVRDKIPEIIRASGKRCVVATVSDEDYLRLLDQKL